MIHRDIKPGNIWLEERTGRIKLLDFGLARAADGGDQLTNAGDLLGTPSYMAPEQARGDAVDTRADLFSLGCVMYQMAVGRRPFEGRDALSTLYAVSTQPVRPPREINPELPESIERLILRLLEKDPAARIQSAEELIAEIRELESAPQQTQLIDFSSSVRGPETASIATAPQPAIRSADKPPRNVRRLAIAAAAAAAACILCGVIVIKIKHRDGTEDTITVNTKTGDSLDINLSDADQSPGNESTADRSNPQSKIENQEPWRGWPADAPAPAIAPFDAEQAKKHQQEWADHLQAPLECVNSIGMKLVLIPPGEFLMGSTDEQTEAALKAAGEDAADQRVKDLIEKGQRPQHKGIISKPFSMGATEVTVGQFRKFVEATKYVTEAEKYGFGDSMFVTMTGKITEAQKKMNWRTPGHELADDLPATQVTWNDAQAFCRWLSTQEKATYRLPTEAEWEYACRGGTTTQFSFGDDHTQLGQYGWFVGNTNGAPHPVGAKLPNAFLFDTHGNLWEWCSDVFDEKWYEKSPTVDPTGPSLGRVRALRGGFWATPAHLCRSTTRYSGSPSWRNNYIGFRCVKALDVPPTQTSAIRQIASDAGKSENPKPAPAWRGWSADAPEPAIAPFDAAQAKKRQQEWADHLKLPLEYTNSIGMKFVLIPPGEFTMGSTAEVIDEAMKVINRIIPDNKLWHEFVPSEAPPHKVVITRPFYLSVYEVTQHEYETVMGVNPSNFAKTSSGESSQKVAGLDTTSHPVENVRWNDAAEFCAKLSQKEEFKPFYSRSGETVAVLAGAGYRLPTEAEWEFACRAGTTAKSWAGEREQDLLSAGWFKENAGGRTHPVGQLASNPFGLFDVFGNVMEWVEDSWQPAFYEQFAGKLAVDPKCGLTSDPKRSFRGGAWYDIATFWRSATRFGDDPVERGDVGIRVVLMPDALRREAPAAEPRPETERADAD